MPARTHPPPEPAERPHGAARDSDGASDEALMLRYQRGDREAFVLLLRRHQAPMFNFARRFVRSQATAEEVTQETFLRVVQRAAEFKHEARFTTWLYTIARNLSVDATRRQRVRAHASLDAPHGQQGGALLDVVRTDEPRADASRAAEWSVMRRSIVAAVDALPEEQREVFLLREVADLPFREIAEITGVPENTVKSRMRYALERLRAALADFEEYARALR